MIQPRENSLDQERERERERKRERERQKKEKIQRDIRLAGRQIAPSERSQ